MEESEGLIEFYLATLWEYKPNTVKRVIDDLSGDNFDHAEFRYDNEYGWFEVTCREEDALEIRKRFAVIAREIEDAAFEAYEDSILEDDDTLKPVFDNEWFSRGIHCRLACGTDETTLVGSRPPETVAGYPHSCVWDDLDKNDEPYSIRDLLVDHQLERLKLESGVGLFPNPNGKLIHIGAANEAAVCKARDKLNIILAIKKLSDNSARVEHLAYAEDYVERELDGGFTADIRYLANIDPGLVSSTLLDRLRVGNLEDAYLSVYRQGASIRVCLWAPEKQHRISLLGPVPKVKRRDRSILGNRPRTSKNVRSVEDVGGQSLGNAQDESLPVKTQVEMWIKTLPTDADSDAESEIVTLHSEVVSKISSVSTEENLIDLVVDEPGLHEEKALSVSRSRKPSVDQLAFTGNDCLIDMLARVETVDTGNMSSGIDWNMSPLIPSPASGGHLKEADTTQPGKPQQSQGSVSASKTGLLHSQQTTKKHRSTHKFKAYLQSGAGGFSPAKHGSVQQPSEPASKLLATDCFVVEIEAAMIKLLSLGPYQRGKLAVKVEFGRAILNGAAPSGVAFNDARTPSNGWEKATLLGNLNDCYGDNQKIHFTKILSTYACDLEDMIGTKADGTRLWEEKPSRAWTVYSFHCVCHSMGRQTRFAVDVEDDPASSGVFTYSIRAHNATGAGALMPVYVHAICRNWDLRVAVSHTLPEEVHPIYNQFATALLDTLDVFCNAKDTPTLEFSAHGDSAMSVDEVRVLTKWRHLSLDHKSALDITEVERLQLTFSESGNGRGTTLARPCSKAATKALRSTGEFPRWYEAEVVSLELEQLCRQNLTPKLGEKASWNPRELSERGVFATLYRPALRMVQEMDHVGRLDNNGLSEEPGHQPLWPNRPAPRVPGAEPASPPEVGKRRRVVGLDDAKPESMSVRSGKTTARGSSSSGSSKARSGEDGNPWVKFW